jgi:hypothetical protein
VSQVRILPGALPGAPLFPQLIGGFALFRLWVGPTSGLCLVGERMTRRGGSSLVFDGLSRGGIEAYRYVVKVGWEQPCIVIERRCSRLVAKQACNGNDRSSRLCGLRCRGVAQVVRSDL